MKVLGFIEVEDTGYATDGVDADLLYFYNPETKKCMQLWVGDPAD